MFAKREKDSQNKYVYTVYTQMLQMIFFPENAWPEGKIINLLSASN